MKVPIRLGAGGGGGDSDECTATAADILEGKTAIYNGSNDEPAEGTMKNVGSIDPAKSQVISNGVFYARMTNGAHVTNASSGYPEVSVPQADLASAIGLSADIIKKGVNILGMTGTWEGFVADTDDLYYQGTVGTLGGSMDIYQFDTCTVSLDRSCVTISSNSYSSLDVSNYNFAGVVFNQAINCADYDKLTVTYNVATAPYDIGSTATLSNEVMVCLYSSRPSTSDELRYQSAVYYEAGFPPTYESTGNTVTLDISGINQTLYVGTHVRGAYANTNLEWVCEITRISVS